MQPKRVPVVSAKPAVPRRPGEFPPLSHLFFFFFFLVLLCSPADGVL